MPGGGRNAAGEKPGCKPRCRIVYTSADLKQLSLSGTTHDLCCRASVSLLPVFAASSDYESGGVA